MVIHCGWKLHPPENQPPPLSTLTYTCHTIHLLLFKWIIGSGIEEENSIHHNTVQLASRDIKKPHAQPPTAHTPLTVHFQPLHVKESRGTVTYSNQHLLIPLAVENAVSASTGKLKYALPCVYLSLLLCHKEIVFYGWITLKPMGSPYTQI